MDRFKCGLMFGLVFGFRLQVECFLESGS